MHNDIDDDYFAGQLVNMTFFPKGMLRAILLFILISCCITLQAQHENLPLSKDKNREILRFYDSRAKDFASKNLNRFALERLLVYDRLLDSLYESEIQDTLRLIEQDYVDKNASLQKSIVSHRTSISDKSNQKDVNEKRYSSLLKRSLLSFALWLIVILLILQLKKSQLKKARIKLDVSSDQLKTLDELVLKTDDLSNFSKNFFKPLEKANDHFTIMTESIKSGLNLPNTPVEWPSFHSAADRLAKIVNTDKSLAEKIIWQLLPSGEDKADTEINSLCEHCLEIALRGTAIWENFECQVTRDFEKKLPTIKINQTAVSSLLLNVLLNAFQSVREKNLLEIKGYQPKVSMSTRILPRFLQIRIRDNGLGMNDSQVEQCHTEFYTTKTAIHATGLGLSVSNKVISEMHKGEIKIESEEGNSTDVYIKFFI